MKKKLLIVVPALVCVFVCAFALFACDGGDDNGNGDKDKPNAAHVHNYTWVDNGDGTHKQYCSVGGCDRPEIKTGKHNYIDHVCNDCNSVSPTLR